MPRSRRRQHLPWNAAGRMSEEHGDGDAVVRETGWVFNNRMGRALTLSEFVDSGEEEVHSYLIHFGFGAQDIAQQSLVEIGAGIGRMTAGFTRRFQSVVACDLDAAFLERCRETVARFGRPERLSTLHTPDGRTLHIPDQSVDMVFSYITLQHCERHDALQLTAEAIRTLRPGGHVVLNYRTWVWRDIVLYPVGVLMRWLWRLPVVGSRLARMRWSTRLGWQANRLNPQAVFDFLRSRGIELDDPAVWVKKTRRMRIPEGIAVKTYFGINPSHWWLIARRASAVDR